MKNFTTLDDINKFLDEALERVEAIEHKVKHGKYKIQRKKIKDQVLDGSEPRDIERENICKNARKKAHTSLADTKQEISKETRDRIKSCNEELEIVNESATTISGMYGLDFMEESVGWDVNFTFFDKPQVTPLSESLDVGTTKTGRKRKCKALGIAEGVFAPIISADGERVFSRNNRLYESDHWDYQLENMNFYNKVHSRRMLGMIGHEDKKVTDQDLRDGKVSHIVTDLEIREDDEHGKYLWGRLEIINTEAGRNLKEYYEQDIPLFVSSRGGGKLLDVPGKNYKKVDKTRYYCECFDVVREPGFLGAAPVYHSISEENTSENKEVSEIISKLAESLNIEETKLLKVIEENVDNGINEDKNMSKVNCDIDTTKGAEDIIAQLLKPISEKISQLSDKLDALEPEVSEEAVEAEEAKSVEAEAPAEVSEEKKCDCGKDECPECGKKKEQKDEAEKCSEAADAKDDKVTDADATKADIQKKEQCQKFDKKKEEFDKKVNEEAEEAEAAPAEEPKAEEVEEVVVDTTGAQAEEIPAEEPANEEWAHIDPKETAPARADLPKPPLPNGGGAKDLGEGAWAKEDPKETAPEKSSIADGKNPAKTELEAKVEGEIHAEEKKDAAAVNAGIEGGANVTAHESKPEEDEAPAEEVSEAEEKPAEEPKAEEEKPAEVSEAETEESAPVAQSSSEFTQQVTDYKSLYETLKEEFDKCNQVIDELLESIEHFGKRHKEIVLEAETTKAELDSVKEQFNAANKALNSYKLQEKFNITVDKANELLSSKDYETVVEELKAAEAQKIEEEAQATAEAVSESLSEANMQKAPVSRRKAHSAFSATLSESKDEEVSESVETHKRRRAYSAF